MVTSFSPKGSILGGSDTLASTGLSLNTGYYSQSGTRNISGLNSLTEHIMLGINNTIDAEGWATMIDTMYQTLQRNSNRTPAYNQQDLSMYVSFVEVLSVLYFELARDLKIGLLTDPYALSLTRDILGTAYDTIFEDTVKNRDLNISLFNYQALNLRNSYPSPATSRRELGKYLLGNYFRDDEEKRGQYIMFHSAFAFMPTYGDLDLWKEGNRVFTQQTISTRLQVLDRYKTFMLSLTTIQGMSGPLSKTADIIAADITRVYGPVAYWDAPIISTQDIVVPITDATLMKCLNADPFGRADLYTLAAVGVQQNYAWARAEGSSTNVPIKLSVFPAYSDVGTYTMVSIEPVATGSSNVNLTEAVLSKCFDQRPILEQMSDTSMLDNSPELTLLFTAVPQVDQLNPASMTAKTASGYSIAVSWYNQVNLGDGGTFEITQIDTPPVMVDSNNTSAPQTPWKKAATAGTHKGWVRDVVTYEWINGLTPGVMSMNNGIDSNVVQNYIYSVHAEVDELTIVEQESVKRMLVTISQRYNDALTLFATKKSQIVGSYKQGDISITARQSGGSNNE